MRFSGILAVAVVAALGFSMAGQGKAADRGFGPRYYGGSEQAVEWREGYYADCRRRYRGDPGRDAYQWREGSGPNPNSFFLGPLGYHCHGGYHAYLPMERCRTYFVSGPHGWVRVRRCN